MMHFISTTIRQASFADLELIVPLFDAYRQFYRKESDLALARRFLRERFDRNESTIFVAFGHDGTAIGFTQLFPSFSSGSAAPILILNDLFVVPVARHTGIGRQLLRAAATFGQTMGAIRLTLSTEVGNSAARALYEAEGWLLQTDYCVYNLALTPKSECG